MQSLTGVMSAFEYGRYFVHCTQGSDGELLVDPNTAIGSLRRSIPRHRLDAKSSWIFRWLESGPIGASTNVLAVVAQCDDTFTDVNFELGSHWLEEFKWHVLAHRPQFQVPARSSELALLARQHLRRLPISESSKTHLADLAVRAVRLTVDAQGWHPQRVKTIVETRSGSENPLRSSTVEPGLQLQFQLNLEAQLLMRHSSERSGRVIVITEAIRYCCHWRRLSSVLSMQNVAVLICQRTIDDECIHALAMCGVVAIERVSIRYVTALAACVRCNPSLVSAIAEDGAISQPVSIRPSLVKGRHGIFIGAPDSGVATVVLCPSAASESDAIETAFMHAVRAVSMALNNCVISAVEDVSLLVEQYLIARSAFERSPCCIVKPHRVRFVASQLFNLASDVLHRGPIGCPTPPSMNVSVWPVEHEPTHTSNFRPVEASKPIVLLTEELESWIAAFQLRATLDRIITIN